MFALSGWRRLGLVAMTPDQHLSPAGAAGQRARFAGPFGVFATSAGAHIGRVIRNVVPPICTQYESGLPSATVAPQCASVVVQTRTESGRTQCPETTQSGQSRTP